MWCLSGFYRWPISSSASNAYTLSTSAHYRFSLSYALTRWSFSILNFSLLLPRCLFIFSFSMFSLPPPFISLFISSIHLSSFAFLVFSSSPYTFLIFSIYLSSTSSLSWIISPFSLSLFPVFLSAFLLLFVLFWYSLPFFNYVPVFSISFCLFLLFAVLIFAFSQFFFAFLVFFFFFSPLFPVLLSFLFPSLSLIVSFDRSVSLSPFFKKCICLFLRPSARGGTGRHHKYQKSRFYEFYNNKWFNIREI